MRIFISCLWLTVFLISCGKKSKDANRIPIDKMKLVVFQLMQADEHFSRVSAADSTWNIQHKNIQSYQKIFDFNIPPDVQRIISFLLFSLANKSATHLVPFPQAPETLPSEL